MRPAARRIRTISAADGVAAPVTYVDSREGDMPISAADCAWVLPDRATSSRTSVGTSTSPD